MDVHQHMSQVCRRRSSTAGTTAFNSLATRATRRPGQRLQTVGSQALYRRQRHRKLDAFALKSMPCRSLLLGSWPLWRQSPESQFRLWLLLLGSLAAMAPEPGVEIAVPPLDAPSGVLGCYGARARSEPCILLAHYV